MNIIESIKHHKKFAFDLETYSPCIEETKGGLIYWVGKIRLVAIATPDAHHVIDLGRHYENLEQYKEQLIELNSLICDPAIVTVGHNVLFDLGFWGYFVKNQLTGEYPQYNRVVDTMVCSQWLYAGTNPFTFKHGLKDVCKRELGLEMDKTDQKFPYGSLFISQQQYDYAAKDAWNTLQVYLKFSKMAAEDNHLAGIFKLVNSVIPAFADMVLKGYTVDIEMVKESQRRHLVRYQEEAGRFQEYFPGWEVTAHPAKLKALLNETYGLSLETADKAALEPLTEDYPAIAHLMKAKKYKKQLASHDQFVKCYRDGSVYANYKITASEDSASGNGSKSSTTGRTSSSKFGGKLGLNMQNVNKPYELDDPDKELISIRDCMKAPDGYKLIVSDYSAAHARIAAQLGKDEWLIRSYNDNLDSHLITAANLAQYFPNTPTDWKEGHLLERYTKLAQALKDKNPLCKRLRNISKTVFYLALNAGGKKRLQVALGEKGIEVSEDQAKMILRVFWETYEGLSRFCNTLSSKLTKEIAFPFINKDGEEENEYYQKLRMPWGTIRYFKVYDGNYGRQCKINDLVASHWLGCEGIAMFGSIAEMHQKFVNTPEWGARILTVVHDEINTLCKEEYALEVATYVQKTMDKHMKMWIKDFPASPKQDASDLIATCWSEK